MVFVDSSYTTLNEEDSFTLLLLTTTSVALCIKFVEFHAAFKDCFAINYVTTGSIFSVLFSLCTRYTVIIMILRFQDTGQASTNAYVFGVI